MPVQPGLDHEAAAVTAAQVQRRAQLTFATGVGLLVGVLIAVAAIALTPWWTDEPPTRLTRDDVRTTHTGTSTPAVTR
jgi:hypothetical protein